MLNEPKTEKIRREVLAQRWHQDSASLSAKPVYASTVR